MSDQHHPRRVHGDSQDNGLLFPLLALSALSWAMALSACVLMLAGVVAPAVSWAAIGMSALVAVGWLAAMFVGEE